MFIENREYKLEAERGGTIEDGVGQVSGTPGLTSNGAAVRDPRP